MIDHTRRHFAVFMATLIVLILASVSAAAQADQPASRVFTLEGAVNFALKNYPAVRASLERVSAARGGVALARTSYWPRADMLWQSNRASRNNIFGLLLPQSVIPAISGPVLPFTSNSSAWGSAAGALLSWEPFDFGYRRAIVEAARAAQDRANGEAALTGLDIAAAAADTFLNLVAAQERVRAAQADVDRRQVLAKSVHVLADNQLRPGADASRADAELAAARTRLFEAEATEQETRAALAAILGIAGGDVKIDPGPLLALPRGGALPAAAPSAHPFARVGKARIDESAAKLHALDRSFVPHFNFQSAIFGRGSGANTDGTLAGGLNGLGLERANWAAGVTLTFPLLEFASIRARKQIEAANERAEEARYNQALQDLTGQTAKARAAWEGARRVAENTPVQLRAARDNEAQAGARFQAGLTTIVDVSDAQRLLVQAEIEDALARLNVWRALGALAAAQGSLEPFMQVLRESTSGGP